MQHRLQTSLRRFPKQLESVNKGLGEQTVAPSELLTKFSPILRRVGLYELQLGQIIEDIFDPSPVHEREFVTVPQSSERVSMLLSFQDKERSQFISPIYPLNSHWKTTIVWKKLCNRRERGRSSVTARPFLASIKLFC